LSFVTQLLPGLRDVRGPLIAGYLWLLTGWLLLADRLPQRHSLGVYSRAFEAGDALGRVGLAAAASIAAYLIGSLLGAVPNWIDYGARSLMRRRIFPSQKLRFLPPRNARQLLNTAPVFSLNDFRWVDGDPQTKRALSNLVMTRLKGCADALDEALDEAAYKILAGAKRNAKTFQSPDDAAVEIEALGTPERGWEVHRWVANVDGRVATETVSRSAMPSFSAARDLFGERSTLKTRLIETAPQAGSEVERLYAESEFRFTISFPLAAVAIVLSVQSGDLWWLGLLGVVAGLFAHSIVLRKHGGRELIEALRSRPDDKTLRQVTPVFAVYASNTEKLIEALGAVNWEALGASAQRAAPGEAPGPVAAAGA
jgi:hypothetical protein